MPSEEAYDRELPSSLQGGLVLVEDIAPPAEMKNLHVKDTGPFAAVVVKEDQTISAALFGIVIGLTTPSAQTSLDLQSGVACTTDGFLLMEGRTLLLAARRYNLLPFGIGAFRMRMPVAVAAFVEAGLGCGASLTLVKSRARGIDSELLQMSGSTEMHGVLHIRQRMSAAP